MMKIYWEPLVERWHPIILGLIFSMLFLFFYNKIQITDSYKSIFITTISISAISIGFLATSKSILFSIQKRQIINQIKQANLYESLIDYLMTSINLCFLLAVISAICFLIFNEDIIGKKYLYSMWLFIITSAFTSCYRVIRIFSKILRLTD